MLGYGAITFLRSIGTPCGCTPPGVMVFGLFVANPVIGVPACGAAFGSGFPTGFKTAFDAGIICPTVVPGIEAGFGVTFTVCAPSDEQTPQPTHATIQ